MPGRLIGIVRRPAGSSGPDGSGGAVLDIRDYAATITGGVLVAGDDADDAVWAGPAELDTLPLTAGLLDALRSWGAL
jgi:acetyl-CoA carboxylase carboxyl transferase subunit beta